MASYLFTYDFGTFAAEKSLDHWFVCQVLGTQARGLLARFIAKKRLEDFTSCAFAFKDYELQIDEELLSKLSGDLEARHKYFRFSSTMDVASLNPSNLT
jgi:hypothetical protein